MKVYTLTDGQYALLLSDLLDSPPIHTGEWQSMNTSGSKPHATHELEDVTLVVDQLPETSTRLANLVPNVDEDWATDHFQERVSGIAHNPPPSALSWPYAVRSNGDHTDTRGQYDHTYPERFWPKHADRFTNLDVDPSVGGRRGIRFAYGDLADVVDLLVKSPLTRQAYLPVWFPEDTGAVDGQRVPCTLGYHFMVRRGRLSVRYYIRSCDAYRHLSNDIYLAGRLAQWMVEMVNTTTAIGETDSIFESHQPLELGGLIMHISSLHSFVGDGKKIRDRINATNP
jgi:hypothetical protein